VKESNNIGSSDLELRWGCTEKGNDQGLWHLTEKILCRSGLAKEHHQGEAGGGQVWMEHMDDKLAARREAIRG
jgi:hypothetical protein